MMSLSLVFFLLIGVLESAEAISRAEFPDGFIFGTASSAFQVRMLLRINNIFMFMFHLIILRRR